MKKYEKRYFVIFTQKTLFFLPSIWKVYQFMKMKYRTTFKYGLMKKSVFRVNQQK